MPLSPSPGDRARALRTLLDAYLGGCAAHGARLDSLFGPHFSGCSDDTGALVTDPQEWLDRLRHRCAATPLQLQHLSLQDIGPQVVLGHALLRAPGPQHPPDAPEDAALQGDASVRWLLVFHCVQDAWKIAHHSCHQRAAGTPQALVEALQRLTGENQALQQQLQAQLQELQKKEILYRQLTEDTHDVLWQTDGQLCLTYISSADERLRGFPAAEVLGRHVFEMFTPDGIAIVQQKIQDRLQAEAAGAVTGFSTFEVQHRCKDGRLLWGEVMAKPHRDAQGRIIGYHGITRETTERKLLQDQVHALAFYDPLTRLANRRLLIDHLQQAVHACQRQRGHGAVLFLDLDNFKALNDAHGHGAGDLLLIEAAQRLQGCVRAIDTVARFGGDEFVVLLTALDSTRVQAHAQAGAIAEKIRACLAQPYQITVPGAAAAQSAVTHRCSASIGVRLFDGNDHDTHHLMDQADAAMYQAKQDGRNRVCFHSDGAQVAQT